MNEGQLAAPRVVVLFDDNQFAAVPNVLRTEGYCVVEHEGLVGAAALLEREEFDLLICALCDPNAINSQLLAEVRTLAPALPIVVLGKSFDVETVMRCFREGASDLLLLPVDNETLVTAVERALAPQLPLPDVSDPRVVEKQVAKTGLLGRLRQVERLRIAGEASASMAHEINNCLNVIICNLEYALDKFEHTRPLETVLQEAFDGTCDLRDIVLNMRSLQSRDQRFVELDLNELILSAIRLSATGVRACGGQLIMRLDRDVTIIGNRAALMQVFVNLIVNAGQALADFESCEVKRRVVTVTSKNQDDCVLVEVTDNGPGIPQVWLDRVFEPFFTTKTSGTGLGLAIARDLAERHRGSLDAHSEIGRGSTFALRLPRS